MIALAFVICIDHENNRYVGPKADSRGLIHIHDFVEMLISILYNGTNIRPCFFAFVAVKLLSDNFLYLETLRVQEPFSKFTPLTSDPLRPFQSKCAQVYNQDHKLKTSLSSSGFQHFVPPQHLPSNGSLKLYHITIMFSVKNSELTCDRSTADWTDRPRLRQSSQTLKLWSTGAAKTTMPARYQCDCRDFNQAYCALCVLALEKQIRSSQLNIPSQHLYQLAR